MIIEIKDDCGHMEPSGTLWNPLGPSGTLWNPLGTSGTLWAPLEPSETLWAPGEKGNMPDWKSIFCA